MAEPGAAGPAGRPGQGPPEPPIQAAGDTDTRGWALVAARAAASKTDEETLVLDVGDVLAITSWFVITGASNTRQVKTIVEEVEDRVAEAGGPRPRRVEGLDTRQWVLMDYGDLVVHVFLDETRRFYELERLWADVPRIDRSEWSRGDG